MPVQVQDLYTIFRSIRANFSNQSCDVILLHVQHAAPYLARCLHALKIVLDRPQPASELGLKICREIGRIMSMKNSSDTI